MKSLKATVATVNGVKRLEYAVNLMRHYLSSWKDGTQVIVTLKEDRETRTDRQNKYLWLYWGIVSEHTGYHRDEVHEMAKAKFLSREVEFGGEVVRITGSTKNLDTKEFTEFLDRSAEWFGLPLPPTDGII